MGEKDKYYIKKKSLPLTNSLGLNLVRTILVQTKCLQVHLLLVSVLIHLYVSLGFNEFVEEIGYIETRKPSGMGKT